MSLKNASKGGRLSARDLRRLASAADAARPAQSFGASGSTVVTAGGVGEVATDDDWFPAEIVASVTGGYTFKEQWVDGTGAVADKPSGRQNSSTDPAAVLGSATYSAGDKVLVRRARGAGGLWWEVAPQPAAGGGTTVFVARLTTSSSGAWKWVKQEWTGAAYADTSSESATFNARPATLLAGGTLAESLVAGQRVVMWESAATSGVYEFIPPVGAASATLGGYVSNGAQSIKGAKTFKDDATFEGDVDASAGVVSALNVQVGGGGITVTNADVTISGTGAFVGPLTGGSVYAAVLQLGAIAAGTVGNNSLFLDSADNRLKWKDNGGTVTTLV